MESFLLLGLQLSKDQQAVENGRGIGQARMSNMSVMPFFKKKSRVYSHLYVASLGLASVFRILWRSLDTYQAPLVRVAIILDQLLWVLSPKFRS